MRPGNWTREELILAFNLYCKIPFGTIYHRNPQIVALAKLLGRTPSAVSWKLANLASLDPSLKRRNIVGASHASRLDAEVWAEFSGDWDHLAFESERLLAKRQRRRVEDLLIDDDEALPRQGKERQAVVKQRVNQSFFRRAVLSAYGSRCCITGLTVPVLLVASHIVPWSKDEANRVNPRNGLCLNTLHDRAFDAGLITITPEYRVEISPSIVESTDDPAARALLGKFDGRRIRLPGKFLPDPKFLEYHNRYVFRRDDGDDTFC
jgi:putative restriction endonuclease